MRNLAEVIVCAAHFVRKAQRHAAKAVAHRLDQKMPLARGQHDPGKADNAFAAHGVADHRKRFLVDLLARHDVIRLLEIPRVDLPRARKRKLAKPLPEVGGGITEALQRAVDGTRRRRLR